MLKGIQLAWDLGIKKLIVEVDSQCAVQQVQGSSSPPNANSTLIREKKQMLGRDWQVRILHTYREANYAADWLASFAGTLAVGYHWLPHPPADLKLWLYHDLTGLSHPRVVGV